MVFIPLEIHIFSLRAVYTPLIFFFITMVFINLLSKKDFSYLKINLESIKLNLICFSPFILTMALMIVFGVYPQEDFSHLNRGIPYPEFIFLYSLISVPIQQTLIFGEILKYNQRVFSKELSILFTALFYLAIHLYYPQPLLILISTFVFGILWGYIATKTQSISGNIILHIIVGLLAFYLKLA